MAFAFARSANTVVDSVKDGDTPVGLAFNPSNKDMYVANQQSDSVSAIDSSSNKVVDTVPVGTFPVDLAFNPSNNDMYVTDQNSGTVSIVDSPSNKVVGTVDVGLLTIFHYMALQPILYVVREAINFTANSCFDSSCVLTFKKRNVCVYNRKI